MSNKHTPGPWKTFIEKDENPPQIVVIAERNDLPEWICSCGANSLRQCKANARLIAAAPELLEALEACVESLSYVQSLQFGGLAVLANARAAIAKAKGES